VSKKPKWEAHNRHAGASANKKAARHRYNRRASRRALREVAFGMSSYHVRTKVSWAQTRADLEDCFRKWGVLEWTARAACDHGQEASYSLAQEFRFVTVAYRHPGGREVTLSYGRQDRPVDNFRVLFLAMDALRLNEARGLAEVMEKAYLQLAGPLTERDPYEIMGLRPDADMEIIEAVYRRLAQTRHPDLGGSTEAMTELNSAYERIKTEREVAA